MDMVCFGFAFRIENPDLNRTVAEVIFSVTVLYFFCGIQQGFPLHIF